MSIIVTMVTTYLMHARGKKFTFLSEFSIHHVTNRTNVHELVSVYKTLLYNWTGNLVFPYMLVATGYWSARLSKVSDLPLVRYK